VSEPGLSVLFLGTVNYTNPFFHRSHYIFPAGFVCVCFAPTSHTVAAPPCYCVAWLVLPCAVLWCVYDQASVAHLVAHSVGYCDCSCSCGFTGQSARCKALQTPLAPQST